MAGLTHVQRLRDCREDQGGVTDGGQRHEPVAIRNAPGGFFGDLQGEPGLADPAWSGQGQQRHGLLEQVRASHGALALPANEPGARDWQRSGERRRRRNGHDRVFHTFRHSPRLSASVCVIRGVGQGVACRHAFVSGTPRAGHGARQASPGGAIRGGASPASGHHYVTPWPPVEQLLTQSLAAIAGDRAPVRNPTGRRCRPRSGNGAPRLPT